MRVILKSGCTILVATHNQLDYYSRKLWKKVSDRFFKVSQFPQRNAPVVPEFVGVRLNFQGFVEASYCFFIVS
jgi:hypothetical protein